MRIARATRPVFAVPRGRGDTFSLALLDPRDLTGAVGSTSFGTALNSWARSSAMASRKSIAKRKLTSRRSEGCSSSSIGTHAAVSRSATRRQVAADLGRHPRTSPARRIARLRTCSIAAYFGGIFPSCALEEPRTLTDLRWAAQTCGSMRRRRLSKMLWMVALVPLFLAAVLPDHLQTLVCRFSGAVMSEEACCLPGPSQKLEPQAQLRDEPCCIAKTVELARSVSDRQVETALVGHHDLWTPVPAISLHLLVSGPSLGRHPSFPALGPPIVLLKHSFLI